MHQALKALTAVFVGAVLSTAYSATATASTTFPPTSEVPPPQNTHPKMEAIKKDTTVPTCVTTRLDPPGFVAQSVWITNTCPIQVRVIPVWRFSFDSACVTIESGKTIESRHVYQFTKKEVFDGLKAC